jgi:translation initiation factor IF-2
VRELFQVPKAGTVAGVMVVDGRVARGSQVRLVRDHVVVWTGRMSSLKRFKEDAKEVKEGYECGIGLENFNDIKHGDVIESFEIQETPGVL